MIWLLGGIVIVLSRSGDDGGFALLATVIDTALIAVIFLYALRRGVRTVTTFDGVVLAIASASLVAWVVVDEHTVSVSCAAAAFFLGYLPTARKSIARPHEETLSLYAVSVVTGILLLLAMNDITYVTSATTITVLAANIATSAIIVTRRAASAAPVVQI